ncbi:MULTISPECIES: DMT family transporter [Planktothrix]|jgi:quaternary ammonium compound-resistance protein SugE|uniref:Quaternary ammonium compound-resistance protein SugE n=2 Tax=Planktothrix TaxID=54304 RepID=A0A6J7ZNU0_PLARU|nr:MULTISPECIES: multidrug efflux SMR transporter [Planktothrix]CAD5949844.1 Quaternary ammonium compound-resistance protein SugE [Planktothrix rubescens]CAC5344411.1 Quaternary ammonium compound-resistance protein SugE [Planktothrix rubescens NIVA-CYA 18]CAD0221571.1 Quaternary ammonium compound-resistance protein SugE [Planktothrix agardhii]CAD5916648.1 Quaternary ammonium compound-resistance protein SugE [Planktothrix rubescens NIVA-CYA 18]CAD5924683.1 Quaternary ammonium compound-resistanc
MGWIYLILAGLFELGFSSFLKLSEGMTKLPAILAFIGFGALSFGFLSKAMQTIPLGTAYAVWTGIGALGTIIVGIIYFKDPVSLGRLFFMGLLVVSLIGLKATSP